LLVLFQAPPLAQENEEGVPTNKAKKQGVKANNKTTKQKWGGGGQEVNENDGHQGMMAWH
jgi:uncharacterized glyoxalase superfamily protein PhnB